MGTLTIDEVYRAPLDRVFATFSDFAHAAETISAITKMEIITDGPIGVGTKFRETRKMFGKEQTEEMEITTFEPGRSYVMECNSCGCMFRSMFMFTQERNVTRVVMTMNCKPRTLMAKVMTTVMGPVMRKTMMKCMREDFEDLRGVIEREKKADAQSA